MAFKVFRRHCRGLLLAAVLAGSPALSAGSAWAQAGAVYTATGIDVDVTGDIATLRDQAICKASAWVAEGAGADRAAPSACRP